MALSDARNVALFQILDVPYFAGFYTLDGMGALSSLNDLSGASQGQAKSTILAYVLANIEGTAGLLTVLNTDLDRWIAIGSQVVRIEQGAAGNINGVTYDFRDERALIAERVRIMVPFYKYHEVLARQQNNRASLDISVNRL